VEGTDYFRKDERDRKRWRFLRKTILRSLEALDFLHRSGFCHNAVNTDTLWMTTTNQAEIDSLRVLISDFGACQKESELGVSGT